MRTWMLVAGAMVAAASGSAPAEAAPDRLAFFGGLRVTAASSVCKTEDAVGVGETFRATFQRDSRSGAPRDNLRIVRFLNDYTYIAVNADGARATFGRSGKAQGIYIFSRGNAGVQESGYSSFVTTPTKITATTPTLKITGKIADFDVAGCTVTFEA